MTTGSERTDRVSIVPEEIAGGVAELRLSNEQGERVTPSDDQISTGNLHGNDESTAYVNVDLRQRRVEVRKDARGSKLHAGWEFIPNVGWYVGANTA